MMNRQIGKSSACLVAFTLILLVRWEDICQRRLRVFSWADTFGYRRHHPPLISYCHSLRFFAILLGFFESVPLLPFNLLIQFQSFFCFFFFKNLFYDYLKILLDTLRCFYYLMNRSSFELILLELIWCNWWIVLWTWDSIEERARKQVRRFQLGRKRQSSSREEWSGSLRSRWLKEASTVKKKRKGTGSLFILNENGSLKPLIFHQTCNSLP